MNQSRLSFSRLNTNSPPDTTPTYTTPFVSNSSYPNAYSLAAGLGVPACVISSYNNLHSPLVLVLIVSW